MTFEATEKNRHHEEAEDGGLDLLSVHAEANPQRALMNFVSTKGESPTGAVTNAIRDGAVVGFAETVHEGRNELVQFGIDNMKAFKDAGMTHLAIEMPSTLQPVLDEWMKTGDFRVPAEIRTADGKVDNSDEANGALAWLRKRVEMDEHCEPKYFDLLRSAQKNGVKLAAVDLPEAFAPWANLDPATKLPRAEDISRITSWEMMDKRNHYMAERVLKLRDDAGDERQSVKVGAWLGSRHLGDSKGQDRYPPAGELIREGLAASGEKYTSFQGHASGAGLTLDSVAARMDRAVSLPTHNAQGDANVVGRTKEYTAARNERRLELYDNVLIFGAPQALRIEH